VNNCEHPIVRKVEGKIVCADCGVEMYKSDLGPYLPKT